MDDLVSKLKLALKDEFEEGKEFTAKEIKSLRNEIVPSLNQIKDKLGI